MNKLVLKPVIEACKGGWQAKARLYEQTSVGQLQVACERFNAYDDRNEAWTNAVESSKAFADNHNKTCNCKFKMVVGSY